MSGHVHGGSPGFPDVSILKRMDGSVLVARDFGGFDEIEIVRQISGLSRSKI
jgi:hypothetical protein